MYRIRNAAPRPILRGIRDVSGRPPVYEPELIPTHLPHVFAFTERGGLLPELVAGDAMVRMYGRRSFEPRSQYYNHQSVMIEKVNAEGNRMMLQRVLPPDANPPATARLSVDIVKDDVAVYERNEDGTWLLDETGNRIPTGETVSGYRLRWLVEPTQTLGGVDIDDITSGDRLTEEGLERLLEEGETRLLQRSIGDANIRIGEMVNADGEQSQIYPIADFEANGIGSFGNRLGFRLSAPTTRDELAVDDDVIEDQRAYLYRLQFVERDENYSTPRVLETLWGERHVNFSFKEGVIDTAVDMDLHYDQIVLPSYSQEAAAGRPEIQGPFATFHVYDRYVEEILTMLHEAEAPHGRVSADTEDRHMVNFIGATDPEGAPYEAIRIMGPADDGILLTDTTTHYCEGGFDGTMTLETFDAAVAYQLRHYGDLDAKVMDSAVYPQSVVYDTGFSIDTKRDMLTLIGRRKDMYAVLSTQDVSRRQNTAAEESSMAIALRTAARMYPESIIYGTATCRAMVVGHSGYLIDHPHKELLPLTIELAQKCARYMGAGNGFWKSNHAYDRPPNNHVRLFRGVNADWKTANVRSNDWDNGLVWVQNYDRRSLFFPGIQTVYDDDSSVLNAAINMIIAVELQKVAERTWRDLTGITYLTPDEFIERSDQLIREKVSGKFDGRVIIVPETFYTANDEQRGYSWSTNIHMYAPNMKTVGTFTVVAHRIEDYEG